MLPPNNLLELELSKWEQEPNANSTKLAKLRGLIYDTCIVCNKPATHHINGLPACDDHAEHGVHAKDTDHNFKKNVRGRDRRRIKLKRCADAKLSECNGKLGRHHVKYTAPRIVVVVCQKHHLIREGRYTPKVCDKCKKEFKGKRSMRRHQREDPQCLIQN